MQIEWSEGVGFGAEAQGGVARRSTQRFPDVDSDFMRQPRPGEVENGAGSGPRLVCR
jgi:hypothetical protein